MGEGERGHEAQKRSCTLYPPSTIFCPCFPYLKTSQMNNDTGRYKFRGSIGQMYRQATLTRRHLLAIVELHSCHHVL